MATATDVSELPLDCADVCIATGRMVSRQTEYESETARAEVRAAANPARPAARNASATPSIMSIAGSALKAAAVARQPAPPCSTRSEFFWSHAEAMGARGCGRSAPAPSWSARPTGSPRAEPAGARCGPPSLRSARRRRAGRLPSRSHRARCAGAARARRGRVRLARDGSGTVQRSISRMLRAKASAWIRRSASSRVRASVAIQASPVGPARTSSGAERSPGRSSISSTASAAT